MEDLNFTECMRALWLLSQGIFFTFFVYLYEKEWIPDSVGYYFLEKSDLWIEKFFAFEKKHGIEHIIK